MNIILNGQLTEFNGKTLADLLAQVMPEAPFAVAINTAFVAKAAYQPTCLGDGDVVDIVRPVVGG